MSLLYFLASSIVPCSLAVTLTMAAGAKETKEDKTRRGQKDYPIKGQNMLVLVPPGQTAEFIQSYKGQQGGRRVSPLKVNESQE